MLFECLLFFTANLQRHSGHTSDLASSPYIVQDKVPTKPQTLETQYTLQTLNVPPSWGTGSVPETQIIAHVLGEFYFRSVRAYEEASLSLRTSRGSHILGTRGSHIPLQLGKFLQVNPTSHLDGQYSIASTSSMARSMSQPMNQRASLTNYTSFPAVSSSLRPQRHSRMRTFGPEHADHQHRGNPSTTRHGGG